MERLESFGLRELHGRRWNFRQRARVRRRDEIKTIEPRDLSTRRRERQPQMHLGKPAVQQQARQDGQPAVQREKRIRTLRRSAVEEMSR